MVYNIGNGEVVTANEIIGTAIWEAAPSAASASTHRPADMPAAAADLAVAPADWARFGADVLPPAPPPTGGAALPAGATAAAVRKAEAMLGGLVTFGQ
jgi:hypothetical protein